ncbi:COX15/CtaA family protein [Nocardioides ungokensis]|uniref:COX15/CtaA family protein n=1 Tax=Nocardioides ungokensis TaxID=1643322 RepID=UPI00248468D1|nr:COX15/CtaA family protein [Nocardioides ungokensis]
MTDTMPRALSRTDRWLRPLGWATLVANCVLVVTGGAVRLTGSGLGCPTWPAATARPSPRTVRTTSTRRSSSATAR